MEEAERYLLVPLLEEAERLPLLEEAARSLLPLLLLPDAERSLPFPQLLEDAERSLLLPLFADAAEPLRPERARKALDLDLDTADFDPDLDCLSEALPLLFPPLLEQTEGDEAASLPRLITPFPSSSAKPKGLTFP